MRVKSKRGRKEELRGVIFNDKNSEAKIQLQIEIDNCQNKRLYTWQKKRLLY